MALLASFNSIPLGSVGERVPFGMSDPMGMRFLADAYRSVESVRHGMVVYYNPQTHTAVVLVLGTQSLWQCVIADEPLSFSFGFSATYPPREGELVLVSQLDPGATSGVIIGRIPYSLCFHPQGDTYNDPDQYHRRLYAQDEEAKTTWDRNIQSMLKPLLERFDGSTHVATHFRPTDVYPGEFAHVNQHNCGIKGGMFSATLLGGGASLRMSALSNLARLTCEFYQRHSLSASLHEFHNGRYLSVERNMALFQEERLGWHSPESGSGMQSQVWTFDSKAPSKGENQTMRPRIKEFSGYFGNLVSKFCLRPDPNDNDVRVQGEGEPKEEGVSREAVDPSGQYRLSAAGMIAIERTGRIPVPVRKAYPIDKDHDINETPQILEPFEHDDTDPAYRQLELYDRQAYDLKNQYARVDGLGVNEPDHYVPQETDLKPLQDAYDPKYYGNRTVNLNKYDKRRAGVYIGEDGSVIVRDAWGSEIVMLGGNVSISCAGNVLTLPGQTALTIAGDDIVQKAQNSVDIHASEHDVRLSAARNMEILGGGDESKYSGGVIIESRGRSHSPWDGKDKGEDARLSGITLRTKSQGVVIDGKRVNLRARKDMRLVSGDKDIDGNLSIAAKTVRSRAKTTLISASSGKAHLSVNRNSVSACAGSIGLYAENNFTVIKGGKYPVPLMWADVENVAAKYMPDLDKATEDLSNEKDASVGFDWEALDKMIFGFRKSVECRTDQSWVIGASGEFKLYEPAWVQVMKVFETLKTAGVDTEKYKEDAEWENGKPFPGKESESSAMYAKLAGSKPDNLTGEGFNMSRKEVKQSSSITEVALKDNYLVRK